MIIHCIHYRPNLSTLSCVGVQATLYVVKMQLAIKKCEQNQQPEAADAILNQLTQIANVILNQLTQAADITILNQLTQAEDRHNSHSTNMTVFQLR